MPEKTVYESTYHDAPMDRSALKKGLAKYCNNKRVTPVWGLFLRDLSDSLGIDRAHFLEFEKRVMYHFRSFIPGIEAYAKPLPNEEVIARGIYDGSGDFRSKTSSGAGIHEDRVHFIKGHKDDCCELLDNYSGTHLARFVSFLKNEMRKKIKDTRQILVGQLLIWMIVIKNFGWVYQYFEDKVVDPNVPCAYGWDDGPTCHTLGLRPFDLKARTIGSDQEGQDKFFAQAFTRFISTFLTDMMPAEDRYFLDFYDQFLGEFKIATDDYGNLMNFPTGNFSGGSMTLVFNILQNFMDHAISRGAFDMYWAYNKKFPLLLEYQLLVQSTKVDSPVDPLSIIKSFETSPTDQMVLIAQGDDNVIQVPANLEICYMVVMRKIAELNSRNYTFDVYENFFDCPFIGHKYVITDQGLLMPYYAQHDKALARLNYYRKGDIGTYYNMVNSFRRSYAFSPEGTDAYKMLQLLEELQQWFRVTFRETWERSDVCKTYKTIDALRSERLKLQPSEGGGLKIARFKDEFSTW